MAFLNILNGRNAGGFHELNDDAVVIGRHPACDIVIPEGTVSRRHARILHCEPEGYEIEDLGSQNGTWLNGQRLQAPHRLTNQDHIQIDKIVLSFQAGTRAASSASSEASDAPVAGQTDLPEEAEDAPGQEILSSLDVTLAADRRVEVNPEAKLRAVLEITRNLGTSLDAEAVLSGILESVFRIFPQSERGYILLAHKPDGDLMPAAIKQRREEREPAITIRPLTRSIGRRVMAEGKAILSSDTVGDRRFESSQSVLDIGIRSMMCAPLIGGSAEPLGILYVDTYDPHRPFDPQDLEVLVSVARLAGQAVEQAQHHEDRLKFDRRDRELATAKDVQLQLLPRCRPNVPGYRFFDYYRPADDVGGDYYGYIKLPEGRLAIAVGDVSGKGVSAALLMARLTSDVRYCLVTTDSPAAAVRQLNRELAGPVLDSRFITFALCVLDPRYHEVVTVNAGHLPPLLRRCDSGSVAPLGASDASGPPLGLDPEWNYCQTKVMLEPGDVVLLYTDGISEAMNAEGELYGNPLISEIVRRASGDAEQVAQALLKDVQRFRHQRPQQDDVCLLSFGREARRKE